MTAVRLSDKPDAVAAPAVATWNGVSEKAKFHTCADSAYQEHFRIF